MVEWDIWDNVYKRNITMSIVRIKINSFFKKINKQYSRWGAMKLKWEEIKLEMKRDEGDEVEMSGEVRNKERVRNDEVEMKDKLRIEKRWC